MPATPDRPSHSPPRRVTRASSRDTPGGKAPSPAAKGRSVWMSCVVENCLLDPMHQQATALFYIKLALQEDASFVERVRSGAVALSGVEDRAAAADTLATGELLRGAVFNTPKTDDFPINPDKVFLNEVPTNKERMALRSLCWVRYMEGVVTCQYTFHTTLDIAFHVSDYPFDRHVIPFALALRQPSSSALEAGVARPWTMLKERPDWANNAGMTYRGDSVLVREKTPPASPFRHELPMVCWLKEKPVICLLVARNPRAFVLGTTLPVFLLVMVGLVSFFVTAHSVSEGETTALRMGAVLSSSVAITTWACSYLEPRGSVPISHPTASGLRARPTRTHVATRLGTTAGTSKPCASSCPRCPTSRTPTSISLARTCTNL